MRIDLINMKDFIKKNKLAEVTNPVMYDKGFIPTYDGLLSTDIFGVSTKDRKDTYAYINLNGHFLHPVVFKILRRLNKNFETMIAGNGSFIIKDGVVVPDPEGESGLELLYDNWDNIKFEKNASRMRNERIDLLTSLSKDELFIEQWVVIPAFYRDMNLQKKSPGHHVINNYYSNLIRYASMLRSSNSFDFILKATAGKMQYVLETIYEELKSKIEKKQGIIKKSLLGKSVDYGARLVISAPTFTEDKFEDIEIDFYHTGIPLGTVCSLFTPFIMAWVKNFFKEAFEKMGYKMDVVIGNRVEEIELKNVDLYFTEEYIKKQIDRFINSYTDRFEPVYIPLPEVEKRYNVDPSLIRLSITGMNYDINDPDSRSPLFDRPVTWCDIFYLAAVDVTKDKHVYNTRYPLLDYFGTFPSKITVMSTIETQPVYIDDKLFKNYPVIDPKISKNKIASLFVDTMVMSNLYLTGLGGEIHSHSRHLSVIKSVTDFKISMNA